MTSPDPFPRDRVAATVRRIPAYGRLAWRLAREPLLSRARRAAVVAAVGYLASPIDAVPGVIPVLGQLDDIAVALAAIRFALAGLDADRRLAHLQAVGLSDADVSEDLRTVGATGAWVVRGGARLGVRAGRFGIRAGRLGAKAAVAAGSRVAPRAQNAGRRLAGPAGVAIRRLRG